MEIKSLEQTDFDSLYKGFALAFADYDFRVNAAEFRRMLKRRGFDPALSFAAFAGDTVVSFVLNGIGDFGGLRTAYDTGTGTLKEYRGRGLAAAVFAEALPYLKKAGVRRYLLEVLQHNEKAVALYKKLGFKATREFNYFIQSAGKITAGTRELPFEVRGIDPDRTGLSDFWDFEPSWQNSIDSVKRAADGFVCLGAFDRENLIAYCMFEPASGDIAQIAADKQNRRRGAATLLLDEAVKQIKNKNIKLANTDAGCGAVTSFLKSKNMDVSGKQFEMIMDL